MKKFWSENALIFLYTNTVKHVNLSWVEPTTFQYNSNICRSDYVLLMSLFLSFCFALYLGSTEFLFHLLIVLHVKLLNLQMCSFISHSLTSPSFHFPRFLSLHSSPHSTFSFIASPSSFFPSLPALLISVAVGSLFKCSIGEELRFMQGQCGMW